MAACLLTSCNQKPETPAPFKLLRKADTGLDFDNPLQQSSAFNVFNYMYFFNGGGVAAGDFNNDGLIDLYFVANMGPNKLFLNEGGLKFRDVTETAGVAGAEGWSTGVSVVDLNNDGLLDLYVGQLGEYQNIRGRNQLFICKGIQNGVPVYEDEARFYGLDLTGFSTQAVFFDYDLDGDLDLFQLNHSLHQNGTFGRRSLFAEPHPLAGDRLLRNDTPPGGAAQAVFTDVTQTAGINSTVIGYGLGVGVGDVNNDGYPDLYIGNDFHENDYLYLNRGDGTFSESAREQMAHFSQFSMGVDVQDVDNDGWPDIFSLDMLPEEPAILKSSLGEDNYDLFQHKLELGYHPQFTRNNLQRNNGDGTFSEIGLFAGVAASDWSWGPLLVDFDHDGLKDLFVSNGIPRRMNDIDYMKFQENRELKLKPNSIDVESAELAFVEKMPRVKLPNMFFRNLGKLRFQDQTGAIGNNLPSFSNGAIHADLDNDGDLDVVVNNLEDEPFVYQNLLRENAPATPHSYLSLRLEGPPANRNAIGATALIFRKNGSRQIETSYPVRGFLSSAQIPLHLGIGDPAGVDSILLIWPDRGYQRLDAPRYNAADTLRWQAGLPQFDYSRLRNQPQPPFAFSYIGKTARLDHAHVENPFIEFNRERLIPFMVSREGPAVAVGDIDGDGRDDVFFGSAKRERAALYRQTAGGAFQLVTPAAVLADSLNEEVDAVFADVENDGDLDLIVALGGNEYRGQEDPLRQRAYLNDGKGNFTPAQLFPQLYMTASCVLPADVNGDGLVDFFFGARALPWNYGLTPRSALMINRGNGRFEDATDQLAPGLAEAGLVKNGAWADFDGDGDPDLLLAIEWEAPTLFRNDGGKLIKQELSALKGWWNFVLPGDFDGDGDLDFIAGNLGENSRLQVETGFPLRLYVADFDGNKQVEQILTYRLKDREIPFANYDELTKQLPGLKKKYLFAQDFAKASLADLFGKKALENAVLREAECLQSMYFENTGPGLKFTAHPLPNPLQWSSLNAAMAQDLDGDGKPEIVLAGNFFDSNIEMGFYDALYGNALRISPGGKMEVFPLGNIRIAGQVRKIRPVKIGGKTALIFARNNDRAVVLQPN